MQTRLTYFVNSGKGPDKPMAPPMIAVHWEARVSIALIRQRSEPSPLSGPLERQAGVATVFDAISGQFNKEKGRDLSTGLHCEGDHVSIG